MGPEQARLERLEKQPAHSAETVAAVLPEAVAHSTANRADELSIALEPAMTTAVSTVARNNPDVFGEALAPTIGAAVRKAVRDAFAAMLQRLDEALERSMSIRSLAWRLEAKRTGRPLAEVVLLRTLVYRVEQVFLIHPGSGIVLQHVSAEGGVQDPNQVASMLEAIDSFVREAFRPQPFGVHLSRVEVGDLTIWVDRNAAAVIAAVVRGCAPRELGDVLHEAHERIYLTHRADLARFQSDVSPFAATRPILESCLQGQHRPPPRMARVWLAAAAVLLAVLAGLVVARRVQHARQLRTSVEALRNEPGIVVISADRSGGRLRIDGFRDPLAPPAADVLARHGLPPAEMGFEPFLSLDPRIVERRVRLALRPPPGVTLSVRDGTVRASGVAPRRWIEGARSLAAALPGSERFDEEDLREEETDRRAAKARRLAGDDADPLRPGLAPAGLDYGRPARACTL